MAVPWEVQWGTMGDPCADPTALPWDLLCGVVINSNPGIRVDEENIMAVQPGQPMKVHPCG